MTSGVCQLGKGTKVWDIELPANVPDAEKIPEVPPERKCFQQAHWIVGNVVPSAKSAQEALTLASLGV